MWEIGDGVVGEIVKAFLLKFADNSFCGNPSKNQKTLFLMMKRNDTNIFEPIVQG